MTANDFYKKWKNDFGFRTVANSMLSSVITVLFVLSISLVGPITLMVLNRKSVNMTLIPAIAMATYIAYKVVMAPVNMKKSRNFKDSLVKLLRNINFIDALISILTLQNTLLVVKASADRQDMMLLAAISSAVGLCVTVFMTIWNIIQGRKQIEKEASS
ncbi:MAG: hypothetical protein ACI4EF_04120 [Coprococcus sp.]